jgi:hypothetical protein
MVESRWRIGARGPPWYKCKVVCVMCDSNILSDTNKRLPVYLVKNNWRIPTNASCSDIPQMTRTRSRGDSGEDTTRWVRRTRHPAVQVYVR